MARLNPKLGNGWADLVLNDGRFHPKIVQCFFDGLLFMRNLSGRGCPPFAPLQEFKRGEQGVAARWPSGGGGRWLGRFGRALGLPQRGVGRWLGRGMTLQPLRPPLKPPRKPLQPRHHIPIAHPHDQGQAPATDDKIEQIGGQRAQRIQQDDGECPTRQPATQPRIRIGQAGPHEQMTQRQGCQ